jgi:hypothetical protein
LLGPPLGGTLYGRFGFRGPFIFGIAVTAADLVGRLLIIERKNALKWGYDPHTARRPRDTEQSEQGQGRAVELAEMAKARGVAQSAAARVDKKEATVDASAPQPLATDREVVAVSIQQPSENAIVASPEDARSTRSRAPSRSLSPNALPVPRITLIGVILRMGKSPRALAIIFVTLILS